jgi:hypothetical protein
MAFFTNLGQEAECRFRNASVSFLPLRCSEVSIFWEAVRDAHKLAIQQIKTEKDAPKKRMITKPIILPFLSECAMLSEKSIQLTTVLTGNNRPLVVMLRRAFLVN